MKRAIAGAGLIGLAKAAIPALLLLGLVASGCTTLEFGVEGVPGSRPELDATVVAMSTENAGLQARVATLEAGQVVAPTAPPSATTAAAQPPATRTASSPAPPASPTASPVSTPTEMPAPSAVPTVTALPGLPTPIPAVGTPAPCRETQTEREQAVLIAFPDLSCPTSEEREIWTGRQMFQHGQMLWREDTQMVFVLHNDGSVRRFADTWQEGQPELDPKIRAPQGVQQPIRGFGRVWREQLGGPGARIGWGTEPERGVDGLAQEWRGGITMRYGTELLVILDGGTWKQIR